MTTEKIDPRADGSCTCGNKDLLLVRDTVEYTPCSLENGQWELGAVDCGPSAAEDAVRLFCPNCGQYFNVPEELQ
jgi:hypothetical protein